MRSDVLRHRRKWHIGAIKTWPHFSCSRYKSSLRTKCSFFPFSLGKFAPFLARPALWTNKMIFIRNATKMREGTWVLGCTYKKGWHADREQINRPKNDHPIIRELHKPQCKCEQTKHTRRWKMSRVDIMYNCIHACMFASRTLNTLPIRSGIEIGKSANENHETRNNPSAICIAKC